jgi:SM-20-related protein
VFDELIASLVENHWAMTNDLLPPDVLTALAAEARQQWENSQFHEAGVGRGTAHTLRADIRGDHVLWLDSQNPTPAQAPYGEAMEDLRQHLNRDLYLSLVGFEAHYAVYPPGAFYRKHRDRFTDNDERMLSSVLYLNPEWSDAQGGQLRLYDANDDPCVDILPRLGTFVLFRSETVPHEVLPATHHRYSLTAWFRRRSLLPF